MLIETRTGISFLAIFSTENNQKDEDKNRKILSLYPFSIQHDEEDKNRMETTPLLALCYIEKDEKDEN